MTTLYKFKAYFTEDGVGTSSVPAPVCTVINMADDSKLADVQACTASTNMSGLYSYEYSGADGLDCVAYFHTTDADTDQKDLGSYVTEKITTNLNADVAGVETKVDAIDTILDNIHDTDLPAVKTDTAAILVDTGTDGVVLKAAGLAADAVVEIGVGAWASATRTLTMTATEIESAVSGSSITQIRGDTWNFDIPDLTLSTDKIQFAIKRNKGAEDADAMLFIDKTTGLITVMGAAGTAGDASLTYATTTLTVEVKPSVTAQLPAGSWVYGIQSITAAGVVAETYGGTFVVTADVVKAVV